MAIVASSFSRDFAFFCWVPFSSFTVSAGPVSPLTTEAWEVPDEAPEDDPPPPVFTLAGPALFGGEGALGTFP